MRHDVLRQAEQLPLGLHALHLRPGAQPDAAEAERLRGEGHVLPGDGRVDHPVILGPGEGALQIAANQDAQLGAAQGLGGAAVGVGHSVQRVRVGRDDKAPVAGVDAARAAHAGLEDGADGLRVDGPVRVLPHAAAGENGVQKGIVLHVLMLLILGFEVSLPQICLFRKRRRVGLAASGAPCLPLQGKVARGKAA